MKFSLIFLGIFILAVESQSLGLDCEYLTNNDLTYQCDVKNKELITSKDNREITKVQGDHIWRFTNDRVQYFKAYEKQVKFFPRGLTKFFKNLNSISIHYGNLQEITKFDLEEFGEKLINLWLWENEIQVIHGDLLEFNRNLVWIELQRNKIIRIDSGAFDNQPKLKYLYLGNNECTFDDDDYVAYNDREKVLQVIQKTEETCKIQKFEENEISDKK